MRVRGIGIILEQIDFDQVFDRLEEYSATRVGIQLPDGLKFRCTEIIDGLEGKGYEAILSGSGSYGACDIDTNLLDAVDVLLHFGHTQILKLDRVIYVPYFIEYEVNTEDIDIPQDSIALIATAQYAHKLPEVKKELESAGYKIEVGEGTRVTMPGQVLGCNYSVLRRSNADAVLFIGDGLFHPLGAAVYTGKRVYRYSPLSREFEEVDTADFVRKRMTFMAKAMYSEHRGAIIVSSKPGQKRTNLADTLKREASDKAKKVDMVMFEELTPYKLASFPYGYYVNTACPRISYDDAEFYSVPILTPQEYEAMLGLREWDECLIDEIE
ncbi:MAG: diphthamide biosynthesis enzyme Dph2 [Archaeoglobaceae archaeon]